MKVLTVNDFAYVDGGASRVALEGSKWLAAAGHDVAVLAGRGPVAPDLAGLDVHVLGHEELASATLRRPRTLARGVWNVEAGRMLAHVVAAIGPDDLIVHVHGWTKVLSSSVFGRLRSLGVPTVLTAHDYFSICQNGGLYCYPKEEPCVVRPGSLRCYLSDCDSRGGSVKMYRNVRQLAQRAVAKLPDQVDAIVYPSAAAAGRIRPHVDVARELVLAAPSTVQSGAGSEPVSGRTSSLVLGVGRLSPEKGFDDLAAAGRRLGSPWHVAIAGDGPQRDELEAAHPHVTFLGWQTSAEVTRLIRRARVVVFPSRWYETYGLVVEEALAHGVPCIVSDVTAAGQRHATDGSCWLYRSGDVEDLFRCLREATDDAVWALRATAAGPAAADTSPADYVSALTGLYQAVLSDRGRP